MEKRTLTEEERKRLEALIKATRLAVRMCENDLERLRGELKAHETFLRDFDQPVLWPLPAPTQRMQEIVDHCHQADDATLEKLLRIKTVKYKFESKVKEE